MGRPPRLLLRDMPVTQPHFIKCRVTGRYKGKKKSRYSLMDQRYEQNNEIGME